MKRDSILTSMLVSTARYVYILKDSSHRQDINNGTSNIVENCAQSPVKFGCS